MRDFWLGIAPAHRVALLLLVASPLLLVQLPAWRRTGSEVRWCSGLLATLAVVHIGLPWPLGSVLSAGLFGWLAVRCLAGRSWRVQAGFLVPAQLLLFVAASGVRAVAPDQVALTVACLELALLAVSCRRFLARVGTVALVLVFGTAMWAVSLAAHDHDGPDRIQAGTVRRPAGPPPSAVERAAARDLAARVRASTARYGDLAAAEADGYHATGPRTGTQVHFEHKGHQNDGRVLDPAAPEQLVYAVRPDRAILLGVVFQVPVAGAAGPSIGGARWHAHDVCVGLLPPGFGVVSPFGSCPGLTFATTLPEMIHVWTVDPPGGPYADHLDDAWVDALP
ncbi:hypothetical protein ACQEVZ_13190 [Dactylosporangium sp. CA-152071]|uniref:hypothetical protein n=1 Tax=Dactylosporangium sp. CA-152071 TaxID=3239933 RepID=UPI003D8B9595